MIGMTWMLFALLTPVLWALGDVAEKFQLDRVFKHWLSYFTLAYIAWSAIVLCIFVFHDVYVEPGYALLALASGMIGTVGTVFYLKAVSREEASRVVPLAYTSVLFVAVLSYLFLGEVFGIVTYAGMAALLAGAVLMSYRRADGRLLPVTPVLGMVLVSALMSAVAHVIDKTFLGAYDYWTLLFWGYFGGLAVVAWFVLDRKNHVNLPKLSELAGRRRMWVLLVATILVYFAGDVTWLAAISQAPLSIVAALGTTEPLFVLLLAVASSVFTPKLLKEEIEGSKIALKAAAVVLIMIGAYLVAA
ncbi:MAG: EamA family transporter [Candidatus Aenigmatarchaeota archaeon]